MAERDGELVSRVALVTGGGRNIGRAIALRLAADGADVVINVRSNQDEAESVAQEVRALGSRALSFCADIRDEQAVQRMADAAREQLGPITILINNAAVRRDVPFEQMTRAEWSDVLGVILDGAFVCSRAAVPHMLEAGWGRIVNIVGLGGQVAGEHRAHHITAKSGLIGFTKALAVEYAARNITVNAVSPGSIETERGGSSTPTGPRVLSARRQPPIGRLGTTREVAAMVRYLVSQDAAYVTGTTLNINGGVCL